MRFGQAVNMLLAGYGVDRIFGIPGVHTLELFRDIGVSGLVPVVPRHEQGAGFMADAYARVSGRPGVCTLVTGPGVLNALTPIAQAWHDSIPLLVIGSTLPEPERTRRTGALHETPDLAATLKPYTRFSENVRTLPEFAELLHRAFTSWRFETPRPVYVGIPIDVLASEVIESLPAARPVVRLAPAPSDEVLRETAARLAAAARPVLVVGGGARACSSSLAELAESLQAPVVLTGNAKGILPDAHPLNLGTSLRSRATRELLHRADLAVVLGAQLSPIEYSLEPGEALEPRETVRVDLDPEPARIWPRQRLVRMDAGEFAARMLELLPTDRPRSDRGAEIESARLAQREAREADGFAEWIAAIEAALPERANIAVDSAHLAYQSHMYLRLTGAQRWLAPYGLGTLGPALPMAIGAKIAEPGVPALAIAGDGGSLFTLPELATARDLGTQLSYVIWDNSGYREIRNSFERIGATPVGVDTSSEDLAMIARGFGAAVAEVSTPEELRVALAESLRAERLGVVIASAEAAP